MSQKYIAFAVDIYGVTHAAYELDASNDEEAKVQGEKLLKEHPVIEVWDGPQRVARFTKESSSMKRS
jgi:hypothetical protein